MKGVAIRTAVPEDVRLILTFIRELAMYEKLEHEVVASESSLASTLFGPNPRAEVLIAEVDGQPAGLALYFYNYSTFLGRAGIYLEDLYVREAFRGRGAGRLLLARLAAIAVERGCTRLDWAVLDWNEPAIGFYRKLGAVPKDAWTVFRLSGDALESVARGDVR